MTQRTSRTWSRLRPLMALALFVAPAAHAEDFAAASPGKPGPAATPEAMEASVNRMQIPGNKLVAPTNAARRWGRQSWATRNYFPKRYIQRYWNAGYDITHLTYGNGVWAVVLTQDTGTTGQTYAIRNFFPRDFIQNKWREGYMVTSLTHGNGAWAVVMTRGTGLTEQTWEQRPHFPGNEFQQGWNRGFRATNLAYGDGTWAVVFSKGAGYGLQEWDTRPYWPQDLIQQKWDRGLEITEVARGRADNGDWVWAIVTSDDSRIGHQTWSTRRYFPESSIDSAWARGRKITSLEYGDGVWVLATSEVASW